MSVGPVEAQAHPSFEDISAEVTADTASDWLQSKPGGQQFCTLCQCLVAGKGPKAVKSHQKSKQHKQLSKGQGAGRTNALEDKAPGVCHNTNDSEDEASNSPGKRTFAGADIVGNPLALQALHVVLDASCSPRMPPASTALAFHSSRVGAGPVRPCIPPPFIPRPRKRDLQAGQPFVTLQSASLDEVPTCLEQALDLLCNAAGTAKRLPNVDVAGCNLKPKSWNEAGRVLLAAEAAGQPFWASFMADMTHPEWWPKAQHVPTYNVVIVGSGASGIGIHLDVDNYGPVRKPVNTYLCMAVGCKHVVLLPPGQLLFKPDSGCAFPEEPTLEVLEAVAGAGGYLFDLAPQGPGGQMPTLFLPAGWWHWLMGTTPWHVVFGGSCYAV